MTRLWKLIYNIILVPVLWIGFQILRLFSAKVRTGIDGRKELFGALRSYLDSHPTILRVWVHASSMGEFEQAKPIIEMLKRSNPDIHVVATFFSPSGFTNNQRYTYADHISYIPIDTIGKAGKFVSMLRPNMAIVIRYDIWPNHIWTCASQGVPVLLVNATMRKGSMRLWPLIRAFHRSLFDCFTAILTVSEDDASGFRSLRLSRPEVIVAGDTRYDRVMGRVQSARQKPLVTDDVRRGRTVVVFGSSWTEDEEVFLPVLFKLLERNAPCLFIIVPHEPTIEHLETIEYKLRGKATSLRFSFIGRYDNEQVLIVDSIGNLLSLYASADIAFVGGGFKSNVHNTLEPAAYGIPVLYGPKIGNSREAAELAEAGGSIVVHNKQELYRHMLTLLQDEEIRKSMGKCAGDFVGARSGSTEVIVAHVMDAIQ
jgi:3-deoxy-D-manno-octulosonic-acid transferase